MTLRFQWNKPLNVIIVDIFSQEMKNSLGHINVHCVERASQTQ